MKRRHLGLLAVPFVIAGFLIVGTSTAEAFGGGGMRGFGNNTIVSHTATNISNGVQVEITSDDPDAVERIQSRERPGNGRGPCEDVEFTQEDISNGVRITITSDDPDTVERIQERAENRGRGQGMHSGHRGRGMGNVQGGFGRFRN